MKNDVRSLKEVFYGLWTEREQRFDWRIPFVLWVFAFLLRVPLLAFPEVIHNDGTEYIRLAKEVLAGNWTAGKAPPFYPALIGLVSFMTPNYEMAGIWISVIFGTLAVLVVFYLGRAILNEAVGAIAALLAAVQPFLYISSGSVLSESTYHFLLATAVFFGWKGFSQGKFYSILLFSLFTALAFLTRPEAIGFLFVFSVWIFFFNPPGWRRGWGKRVGIILSAIVGFLVFSSPYLVQIRKETGRWEISKKLSISVGNLSEEEAPSIETIKKKKGMTFSSFVKNPLSVMAKIGIGLLDSLYKFQQVYNPILFALAILGWIFLLRNRPSSLKGAVYVMAYLIFFFGLVLPFFFITRRYTSQMISISIPWAAYGFLGGIGWIRQRSEKWKRTLEGKAPLVLLIILMGALFIQGRVIHRREHRHIQREAGLWMKGHLPREGKVMSKLPQEAFYAELPWVRMGPGSYEEILKQARSKDVRYLVVDDELQRGSPGFWEKLREEDLVPVIDLKKKGQREAIFRVVYPILKD